MRTGPKPLDARERLERLVERIPESGCWIFMGRVDRRGYGEFKFEGKKRKAHRVAYSLYNARIRDSDFILHSCDTPSCVNPHHLRPGNHNDNMRDMVIRGRSQRGERHSGHKLKDAQVSQMRNKREQGASLTELAFEFGVSFQYVSALCLRKKRED